MAGSSASEGKLFFKDWMNTFADQVKTVLDVGPGAGVYCDLIKAVEPAIIVHAVEIYEPYIQRFGLEKKYNKVFRDNIMSFELRGAYDLIILGDVLEHLERKDAFDLWWYLRARAKFLWLSLPLDPEFRPWFRGYGHFHQPEADYAENIYEKHLYEWKFREVIDSLGPFVWVVPFRTVGVFVAEGARK